MVIGNLPPVIASRSALTQCFVNLLGNAVKFMAKGVAPQIRVSAELKEENVRLWIEDNGIGIPAASIDKTWACWNASTPATKEWELACASSGKPLNGCAGRSASNPRSIAAAASGSSYRAPPPPTKARKSAAPEALCNLAPLRRVRTNLQRAYCLCT